MVGQLLAKLPTITGKPVKAIAMETHMSASAFYKASQDKRPIPSESREKLSGLNLLGGLAAALEATRYWVFNYMECDRHPHAMIQRNIKEDREADEAIQGLNLLLLDANGPEDLTPETKKALLSATKEVLERIQCDFNLILEIDSKFHLGVAEKMLQIKDKHDTHRQVECRA